MNHALKSNVQILDSERQYFKSNFSGMDHIKNDPKSVNLCTDTAN